jgi:hypothetical protein
MVSQRKKIPEIGDRIEEWPPYPPLRPPERIGGTVIDPETLTREDLLALVLGPGSPVRTTRLIRWDDGTLAIRVYWRHDDAQYLGLPLPPDELAETELYRED